MKKILFLILILSFSRINAQELNQPNYTKWSIGARVGGSLLPDFEDQFQKSYKLGLNGGLNTSFKVNKFLNIKAEVTYAQKGQSYSSEDTQYLFTSFNEVIGAIIDTSIITSIQGFVDDGVYSTYKGYHKLTYVELPLLAEINFYKFKLTTGPYVGWLLKAYTKEQLDQNIPLLDLVSPLIDSLGFAAFIVDGLINSTFPGFKETSITESSSTTNFTQFNYGFIVQLSYQIHQNTFLEARYSRCLNSYLVDKNLDKQLSSFTLSLAYNFGIKKLKK